MSETKLEIHPELVTMLSENITKFLKGDRLNVLNVMFVVTGLMQLAEKYSHLSGPQKKELVLQALQKYLDQNPSHDISLPMIPGFIDASVAIDKGEIKIKLPTSCFGLCCKK